MSLPPMIAAARAAAQEIADIGFQLASIVAATTLLFALPLSRRWWRRRQHRDGDP